jgi:acetolactate synthase I/II/III large subunit
MAHVTCGIYLAHLLEAYGVTHVFGIPGVHNVEVYRGLWQTKIRHISPRHEQGAGFMADGYARATGRPGVAFVITGPGLTNIATAMGQAYADSVPMLVISTVNRRHELSLGRGFLHEMPNQRNLSAGLTAFTHTLQRAEEMPEVLAAAFAVFESSRPRPVNIEIPIDVIEQTIDMPESVLRRRPIAGPGPDARALADVAMLLASAKRVMILAGGGAANAGAELQKLAHALQAPVQLTTNARGLLPPDHPLLGDWVVGYDEGRTLMNSADIVLAIGTEIGETDYGFYASQPFTVETKLVRIDIDPRQIAVGPAASLGLVADAKAAMTALNALLATAPHAADMAWVRATLARCAELAARTREPEDPLYDSMAAAIRSATGNPILVGDSTKPAYRAQLRYRAPAPRSFFAAGTGFGTLGYALPAAIGAKLACPDRAVIALMGDGGVQFTLPELISAVEARAGIAVLIWNNHGYGEIRDFMVSKEIAPIGVDPTPPEFAGIAAAMGIDYVRVHSLSDLANALQKHGPSAVLPLVIEARPGLTF